MLGEKDLLDTPFSVDSAALAKSGASASASTVCTAMARRRSTTSDRAEVAAVALDYQGQRLRASLEFASGAVLDQG